MRIAMMTNNYKPFVGGVPISIERLADSLRDLGHSVYVFAPDYKSPVDDDEYTFRFPTMKHKIAGAIPIPNLIYGYVKNAISTLDIDLIHVHHPVMIGNVATRIGKEFHIPVVFTYHTRYEQYLHYLTPFGYLQNKANQGNLLGESILDFAQRQKSFKTLSVSKLSYANLQRNKRRTAVTILALGCSGILFLVVANIANNITAENYARMTWKT